jgi:DNA-binding NarL/FixJ family response regulator
VNAAKTRAAQPGAPIPSRPICVAMVEDVPALRQSVAELVGEASDLRWIAGFSDGETALRELPTAGPDVVLMDIRLPGMSGVECVRERQVLDLLARGRQYKEVANELGLSYHTVRTHVQHIYRKLQVGSKAEAVEVVR